MKSAPDYSVLSVPEDSLARRRRWRRRLMGAGIIVALVAVLLSVRPVIHSLRRWHARRLCAQAEMSLAKGEWQKAFEDLRQASSLQPGYPETLRMQARLLTATGNFAPAAALWRQLSTGKFDFQPNDHRDEARAALETGDLPLADEQMRWLHGKGYDTAADRLLAARLSERRADRAGATTYALSALHASDASERDRIAAAVLVLSNALPAEQRRQAWSTLDLVGQRKNASGLDALNYLAAQEIALLSGDSALDSAVPIDPKQLAQRLESHPLAKVSDRLHAIDLRLALRPSQKALLLDDATRRFSKGNRDEFTALCLWLLGKQEAARMLSILPNKKAAETKVLSVCRIEALSMLGRWSDVERELDSPGADLKMEEITAQLYLVRCAFKLGKKEALQVRWERAFDLAAGDPTKLLLLGGEAEHDASPEIAEKAYRAAVKAQPQDRRAYDALLRLVARNGAGAAYDTLAAMAKQWPNDPNILNSEIYAGLLTAKLAPEEARMEAEKLVRQAPADSSCRATLALALLQLGRPGKALEAFGNMAEDLKAGRARTSTAIVHAAALLANGHEAEARAEAARISPNGLAPEERALIAPLLPPGA